VLWYKRKALADDGLGGWAVAELSTIPASLERRNEKSFGGHGSAPGGAMPANLVLRHRKSGHRDLSVVREAKSIDAIGGF
jgi:hypothetical protein